jgi:hypothetical protein
MIRSVMAGKDEEWATVVSAKSTLPMLSRLVQSPFEPGEDKVCFIGPSPDHLFLVTKQCASSLWEVLSDPSVLNTDGVPSTTGPLEVPVSEPALCGIRVVVVVIVVFRVADAHISPQIRRNRGRHGHGYRHGCLRMYSFLGMTRQPDDRRRGSPQWRGRKWRRFHHRATLILIKDGRARGRGCRVGDDMTGALGHGGGTGNAVFHLLSGRQCHWGIVVVVLTPTTTYVYNDRHHEQQSSRDSSHHRANDYRLSRPVDSLVRRCAHRSGCCCRYQLKAPPTVP